MTDQTRPTTTTTTFDRRSFVRLVGAGTAVALSECMGSHHD